MNEGVDPQFVGPGHVVLRCKHCQKDVARTSYPPYKWVHMDDEVIVSSGGLKITKNWDHEAEPDVIDVGTPPQSESVPQRPTVQQRSRRSPHPFY